MKYTLENTRNTLFGKISKLPFKIKTDLTACVIFIPIIMVLVTAGFGYYTIQSEIDTANNRIAALQKTEEQLITYSIIENTHKAQLQNDMVKDSIIYDLNKEYKEDKNRMKEDFESKNLDSPFYKILEDNIKDQYINKKNDNNRIYIGTKDRVIMDESYTYTNNIFRSWEDIIAESPDPYLTEQAVDHMKHPFNNKSLILWIDDNTSKLTGIPYDNSLKAKSSTTFELIHNAVQENDLNALLQYNIITVAYIFDSGDLFGVPDFSNGHHNDNDKIYIVHTFNIQDILDSNTYLKDSINDTNTTIETIRSNSELVVRERIIIVIVYTILSVLAFFGIWYLSEFFIYFHKVDEENKKDAEKKK